MIHEYKVLNNYLAQIKTAVSTCRLVTGMTLLIHVYAEKTLKISIYIVSYLF